MHRIATLILSSALTFCGAIQTASAQKDDPAGQQSHTLHVNVTTLTLPEYLGMDGAIFHPAPVQQTSVTVSWSGGLYASLWNSMPLGNLRASPNFGRELDYSVGWTGKVSKVTVSLDATCIDVTPLGTIRGNVFQPSITLSHGFALARKNTVEPFLWVRGAMPVLGETPHRGLFLHEGLRHVWTGNGNLSASSSAELIHDSGAFGFNRAYLGRATFGGSYRLKNHWQLLFPIVRWSVPLTHVTDGRRSEFVLGGGLAYSR